MKLIVGLGNIGTEYDGTRHNVGFAVLDELARRHGLSWRGEHERYGFSHAAWPSAPGGAELIRPVRLMNRSGEALTHAARLWDVEPAAVLVVCDDVNLPLGALRLRPQGGPGGHHGLASCLQHLGTEEVPRLRIGVGAAALPRDLTDFVLSPFGCDERPVIREAVAQASDACECWVIEGIQPAMTRANRSDP